MSAAREWLERVPFSRVCLIAFSLIVAWHVEALTDPPYWDALMGAFVQGHWHATHSYSPFALMRDAAFFTEGGACTYPFSVYPTLVGALESAGVGTRESFVVLHLLSFVAAATIVAGTFALLRRGTGGVLAALVAAALLVQPSFRALASQMNMDVLLGACTVMSLLALANARVARSCAWAFAAVAVKPTGIIVVAAVLASLVWRRLRTADIPRAQGEADSGSTASVSDSSASAEDVDRARRRAWLGGIVFLAGVFVLFVLELVALAHWGKSQPGVALFGGVGQFLGKRLWTLPEFALGLAVFLLLAPWLVARILRSRATPLEVDLTIFLLAFSGFYCQYLNVLPRYYLQAWPALLGVLVLAAGRLRVTPKLTAGLLVAFGVVGLVNAHGRFHPVKWSDWNVPDDARPLVSNEGWLLERSLEYRDDLAMNRAIAARCSTLDVRVVADWPILQLLSVPRLGYVERPVRLAAAGRTLEFAPEPIPLQGRLPSEEERVWVVTPNVYDSEFSRVFRGDVLLETFSFGRLRAFLLRRPPGSVRDGR